MPKYCLDTSGISNPWLGFPDDIFQPLWERIIWLIEIGTFCCNTEIFEEYEHIEGRVGDCLKANKAVLVYEINQNSWDWQSYLNHFERMRLSYTQYISEYNGNRKNTIGINDLSIVALAKTLKLPVVSMEGSDKGQISETKMRIPRLCDIEGVKHLTFIDLLRAEGLSL